MTINDQIAVLQASKDGKMIQSRAVNSTLYYSDGTEEIGPAWCDRSGDFNFVSYDYRVKPEPREFWIRKCSAATIQVRVFDEKPPAPCHRCEIVHVREVLPENAA